MTLAATQTNLLSRMRFQSLRRQKLQLCSSAAVAIAASSSRAAQGVERRPSLDGLWRPGESGNRTAPDDPLDGVSLLAMTMIRWGQPFPGANRDISTGSTAISGQRVRPRSTRTLSLDGSTAGVARPIFAAFSAPHVSIHRLRAAMGRMVLTEPDKRGSSSGPRVRTNIEQTCYLGKILSVRSCRRSPRGHAGRPVLCAVPRSSPHTPQITAKTQVIGGGVS
jgi:hypothetical protein